MDRKISNAYEELIRQTNDGRIVALLPARDEAGEPMLWMTAIEFDGVDLTEPMMGLVIAVGAIRHAYREAHLDGVDTLV